MFQSNGGFSRRFVLCSDVLITNMQLLKAVPKVFFIQTPSEMPRLR